MPQNTNLNRTPYYDDFDAGKNFYRILFRPGYSIQARELTQLQSMLQDQCEQIGNSMFKQGQMVIPGEVSYTDTYEYVKLSSISQVAQSVDGEINFVKYDIKQLVGKILVGQTSGVKAYVDNYAYETTLDADTIFVKYVSSGSDNIDVKFRQGESLKLENATTDNDPTLVVGSDGIKPSSSLAMGYGSAVNVQRGIYFINGHFVQNDAQTLILSKYTTNTSYKVGWSITESIITPEDDISLKDNAQGYSNFSAPGAHRLKITLQLEKFAIESPSNKNFVQLVYLQQGKIQRQIKQTAPSQIEEILARRTYDESGDYVVKAFTSDIKNYYHSDGSGFYNEDASTGLVNGISKEDALNKLVLNVGPGKAYIRGYEVENVDPNYIELDKAKQTQKRDNTRLYSSPLSRLSLRSVSGSVPVSATADGEATPFKKVDLYRKFIDSYLGINGRENDSSTGVYSVKDLRGSIYNNDIGVMTVWCYNGVVPGNGDEIDLSSISDIVAFELNNGVKKTLYHYNGSTYDPVDVIAARFNLKYNKDSDGVLAWSEETGSNGMNENSGGNPTHFVQEFILRAPIKTLNSIHASYQSHGPVKTGASGGGQQNGITLYGNDSGSIYYGMILDYTMGVTPIIGRAIARDFKFNSVPSGFDKTKNVVASATQQDTTFDLSYTNPILFTKLKLTGNHAFETGANIIGSITGSTAVVEGGLSVGANDPENATLSHGQNLMLSNVVGEFQEGEEIYDADNSEKSAVIATNGRISHFVVPYGGSNYGASENLSLKIGDREYQSNYIVVSRETTAGLGINGQSNYVHNVRLTELGRREIIDRFNVPPICSVIDTGTHSASDPDAYVRAVLHTNTIQNFGTEDIRSVGMQHGATSKLFTGDIQYSSTDAAELVTITNSLQYSGLTDCDYIEATNFTARPGDELREDDLIQITVDGKTYRYEVYRACNPSTERTGRIYIKQRLLVGFNSNTVTRIRAKVTNAGKSTLILPLANSKIAGTIASDDDSGITYYSRRQFIESVTINGSDNTVSIAAQLDYGQQQFVPFSQGDYVLEVYEAGTSTVRYGSATGELIKDGDLLYLDASMVDVTSGSSTNNAGALTITLPEGYLYEGGGLSLTNLKLKISATIETTKAKPKLKTSVKNKRIVLTADLDNDVIPLRGDDYDNPTGQVKSFSDVYKLRYIYEGGPGIAPTVDEDGNILGNTGTNITDHFLFDDGQRDNLYDTSSIVRKPGVRTPTGTLVIGFDHFSHSEGDFFTVDSYLHENGVSYDEIPKFTSLVHGKKSLSDVVDFRPLVGTSASIPGYVNASVMDPNSNVSEVYTIGGVTAALPADTKTSVGTPFTFSCTYNYYVDRIDTVYLKKDGAFIVKKGAGSTNPQSAETVDEAIKVFKIYIPAYTDNLKKIKIFPIDNKRFTMRDISKLEKRVERVERYAMMSVLEQAALNTQIKDNQTGLDRFKSGFVVDNFESYSLSNINNVDYKAALDLTRGTLRPESKETTVSLVEKDPSATARVLSNYVVNNGVVTLPFSEANLCKNIFATNTVAVNPFLIFNYKGIAEIYPNVDPWFDEDALPSINNNDNQTLDPLEIYTDGDDALSQIHNVTQIAVTGSSTEFSNVNSLSSDAPDMSESEVINSSVTSSSNIAAQNTEIPLQQSSTTIGEQVVSTALTLYIKEQYITFHLRRMKPNTRIYPFIDGLDVSGYMVPDRNYSGLPNSSLRKFGDELVTDDSGNATGVLLIPGGRLPTKGSSYEENPNDLTFDTTPGLHFPLGDKKIKFTSSSTNVAKPESFAVVTFRASAIKEPAPNDIICLESLDNIDKVDGTQYTENILNPEVSVSDPLAQTFRIESFEGGVFASSVDLYFSAKDASLPITVKLTDTIAGRPSKNIIPGSTCVMDPNTYIRVIASGSHTLIRNEIIEGDTSNAQGPLIGVLDSQNQPVPVVNDSYTLGTSQVYTLILGDHNKENFIAGEPIVVTSLTVANNARSGDDIVKMNIVLDSGYVSEIVVDDLGDGYAGSTTITIESPQLPGGVTATATPQITDQKVYEITPTLGGSEYTTAPSVLIVSSNATQLASAKAILKITKPAVRMGVATSTKALIPTEFKFQYPVYLENDREYALIIETNSTQYETFISRLGETEINSNSTVTTQPLLGSLFKSQNSNLWTANQYEDLKFDMYMAQFDTTKSGVVELVNTDMGYQPLANNPIETSTAGANITTSQLFAANNKVIKVNHKNHGLNVGSYVALKDSISVGGFATTALNRQILSVLDCGIDFYTLGMTTIAGGSVIGGGTNVKALGQIKYEKALVKLDTLDFPETSLETTVTSTQIKAIDGRTTDLVDYTPDLALPIVLNKEYYFPTQRVVASKLNEKLFSSRLNNKKSFVISASLSTNNANLSPIINLKNPKAILTTNRVEAASGSETRYGRKVQEVELNKTVILRLLDSAGSPVTLGSTVNIEVGGGIGQAIKGLTSGCKGTLSYWDAANPGELYVRITEGEGFVLGERIEFSGSSTYNADFNGASGNTTSASVAGFVKPITITGTLPLAQFDISPADLMANSTDTKTGTVTRWNQENYRLIFTSNDSAFGSSDLIGVGAVGTGLYNNGFDIINKSFKVPVGIKTVFSAYGYLFTPDRLKNSSNVATYVTKEISLDNPGNGIVLKLNAALQEIDDVTVMFKVKRASQQIFFSDINWSFFNVDGSPDFEVAPTSGTNFSPTTESQSDFKEYSYTVSNINEFTSFAVKIIMKSRNPALPPRIRDLRAIATF